MADTQDIQNDCVSEVEACAGFQCESKDSLFFCQACDCLFCSECWETQPAHKPRRNSARARGPLHEKVDMQVLRVVQPAFSTAADEATLDARLVEDGNNAWFGISRESDLSIPLCLNDHGKYAELMSRANPTRELTQVPSLISFVGQTGAGKSTLIKLLIQLKAGTDIYDTPCPVVGLPGAELPTSEDVHLYRDPFTFHTDAPILYADCEGLDAGERDPLAAVTLSTQRTSEEPPQLQSNADTKALPNKRQLLWAKTSSKRVREFVVSNFYPRLLFTFSDTVIFVDRNPRAIESVFERLLDWAATAFEASFNQPILPYAIIILNASPQDINSDIWDIEVATNSLLSSMDRILDHKIVFAKHSSFWRDRGRTIQTMRDLMLCYYSSIKVVRFPYNTQPVLIHKQAQKLYTEIVEGCILARQRKSDLRMLLTADSLHNYLQHAFDHYSRTLSIPFDFIQASFLHNPIPRSFGNSILGLAVTMMRNEARPNAKTIFGKLGQLIASCIMLDAVRHNILGTASHIFPQYIEHLDQALHGFCDKYWPCEYVLRGTIPPHLQTSLSTLEFQYNMRASAILYRCCNVRAGHESKGHQLKDGRIFARGGYTSKFSAETYREEFHAAVYIRLERLLGEVRKDASETTSPQMIAAKLHRTELLDFFRTPDQESKVLNMPYNKVCWCCLVELSEHPLSCGHVLCTQCVKSYGRLKNDKLVEIYECPFESYGRCQPQSIYIGPKDTGVRILLLEDGGIRGILQLEILHLLDREFNGKLPLHLFFDFIMGIGSGSLVAIGLLQNDWTLDDCTKSFSRICEDSFAANNRRKFLRITNSACKYQSQVLEGSLKEQFTEHHKLFAESRTNNWMDSSTKLIIPVSDSTGKTVVFANYSCEDNSKSFYNHYRPQDRENEIKVWQAARAAMSHPSYFKPFKHPSTSQIFGTTEIELSTAHKILEAECRKMWPGSPINSPDILVSLGTKFALQYTMQDDQSMKAPEGKRKPYRSVPAREKEAKEPSVEGSFESTWNTQANDCLCYKVEIPGLPHYDDLNAIPKLRCLAHQVDKGTIRNLASWLIAKLFYFESNRDAMKLTDSDLILDGKILCRIPDGVPEICETGKLLRDGKFKITKVIIAQDDNVLKVVDISSAQLDAVVLDLRFSIFISVRSCSKSGNIDIRLGSESGEEYSISGFPRSTRVNSIWARQGSRSQAVSIQRRPEWRPPHSIGSLSLGSGSSLTSNSETSSYPHPTSQDTNTLDTQTDPSVHMSPKIDLPSTHDQEWKQNAMMEQERDRIRVEEVELLKERIKELEIEATQRQARKGQTSTD